MEARIPTTLAVLCLMLSGAGALNVNIPDDLYEFARGDDITLPCSFQTKLSNPKLVIISWSLEGVQANAEQTLILTYYHPSGTTDIKKRYEGRVSVDVDFAKGKADLKMSSITLADNKNFECRVQIPGDDEGKPADTTRLVVLVAPSTPICTIQGKAEYGKNINLTCLSEEGSPTPTYSWESKDVRSMPRVPDPRTTDKGGILSLYNISKDTSGFYICTSRNKIRSASCNVNLTVMPLLSGAGALTVNIPEETYEFARGDDITLPCSFQTKVSKPPLVVISWSVKGVQANAEETLILVYYSHPGLTDIKRLYEGRVSLDVDIAKGKADLKLSSITLADNKNFECLVLILGEDEGKLADTTRLVVLVPPSEPICEIQGMAEYGQNINLTCVSEEGYPPPTYRWERLHVRHIPRVPVPRTTDKGSILSLYDICRHTSGYYICTSRNKVSSAYCKIPLEILPPKKCGHASRHIENESPASRPVFLLYLLVLAITVKAT